MPTTTFPDQAVLVAVGRSDGVFDGATALSGFGVRTSLEVEMISTAVPHLMFFDQDTTPTSPGLWVWEGSIVVEDQPEGTEGDSESRWQGEWRPATLADFGRFGLAVPG